MAVTLSVPRPHPGQRDVLAHDGSVVMFCGRRWGKTQVAVYKILQASTRTVGLYWWVGLSWRSASMKRAWRLLKYYVRQMVKALGRDTKAHIKESSKELILPNGSQIWMRTAENQDSLAGEGIRGVVVDEFTLMKEVVWTEFIQATLADYQGWAWFIGIPKGEGWHAQLWRQAKDRPGWRQYQFTSYDNPTIPGLKDWLDETREQTTEAIFQQEYLAQILPDGGAVFRGLRRCLMDDSVDWHNIEPKGKQTYVIGVDWGRHEDWTVIIVWEVETRRMVAMDRFQEIGWRLQRGRLINMIRYWQPLTVKIEINSIGEPNFEELEADGLPVRAFYTSNASKREAVESLALDIENGVPTLLNDEDLINEFTAFSMQKTRSGQTWTYSAPEGYHDDIVMAACIGYTEVVTNGLGVW